MRWFVQTFAVIFAASSALAADSPSTVVVQLSPISQCQDNFDLWTWGTADIVVLAGTTAPFSWDFHRLANNTTWTAAPGTCVNDILASGDAAPRSGTNASMSARYHFYNSTTQTVDRFMCYPNCTSCIPDGSLFIAMPPPSESQLCPPDIELPSRGFEVNLLGYVVKNISSASITPSMLSSLSAQPLDGNVPDLAAVLVRYDSPNCAQNSAAGSSSSINWATLERLTRCPLISMACPDQDCTNGNRDCIPLVATNRSQCNNGTAIFGPVPWRRSRQIVIPGATQSTTVSSIPSPTLPTESGGDGNTNQDKSTNGLPSNPDITKSPNAPTDPEPAQNPESLAGANNASSSISLKPPIIATIIIATIVFAAIFAVMAVLVYKRYQSRRFINDDESSQAALPKYDVYTAHRSYLPADAEELSFSQGDQIVLESIWHDGIVDAWNMTRDQRGILQIRVMSYVQGQTSPPSDLPNVLSDDLHRDPNMAEKDAITEHVVTKAVPKNVITNASIVPSAVNDSRKDIARNPTAQTQSESDISSAVSARHTISTFTANAAIQNVLKEDDLHNQNDQDEARASMGQIPAKDTTPFLNSSLSNQQPTASLVQKTEASDMLPVSLNSPSDLVAPNSSSELLPYSNDLLLSSDSAALTLPLNYGVPVGPDAPTPAMRRDDSLVLPNAERSSYASLLSDYANANQSVQDDSSDHDSSNRTP